MNHDRKFGIVYMLTVFQLFSSYKNRKSYEKVVDPNVLKSKTISTLSLDVFMVKIVIIRVYVKLIFNPYFHMSVALSTKKKLSLRNVLFLLNQPETNNDKILTFFTFTNTQNNFLFITFPDVYRLHNLTGVTTPTIQIRWKTDYKVICCWNSINEYGKKNCTEIELVIYYVMVHCFPKIFWRF